MAKKKKTETVEDINKEIKELELKRASLFNKKKKYIINNEGKELLLELEKFEELYRKMYGCILVKDSYFGDDVYDMFSIAVLIDDYSQPANDGIQLNLVKDIEKNYIERFSDIYGRYLDKVE